MDYKSRIMQIRKQHGDAVRCYADFVDDFFIVEDNLLLPDELSGGNCDVLKQLYEKNYVAAKDVGKMINFYERIMLATKETLDQTDLEVIIEILDQDGNYRNVSIICYMDANDDGLVTGYVATIRPLRNKEIENREVVAAFTNDKNPAVFINRIKKFMQAQPDRQYAFIQFDIRNFRYVNDKYGSTIGDEILAYINDTLDLLCDENHLHCRLASDIYEIVTYFNSKEEIINFVNMLDSKLHRYQDIRYSLSYGVSIAPGDSTEYRKHGDEAGLARVECKRIILKKVVFYEDTLMVNVKRNGAIEEIEEEALRNGEFHVFLQPKYKYDKQSANIVGAEALVRWIDSDGKIKSPAEFIPVFEQNGFLLEVDQFMWDSVCKLLREWIDDGREPVPISVNVSRTYLNKINIVEYMRNLVESYDLPMNLLQIEITETTENAETIAYVNAFKKAGFTLLMDDFGSGYSSLSMLKETPFDVIKMDRLFLVECLENNNGRTIISHVISMSRELGLGLVAEGVETKEVADFLYDNGCKVSQGFYFSKPISVPDFEKLYFKA